MKKTISLTLAILLLTLSLCSCTKQESIDVYEYCKRYNSQFSQYEINYEDFFKKENEEGRYYSFIDINAKPILITLSTDNSGTVTGIAVTITDDDKEITDEDLSNCFNFYIEMSATLSIKEFDEMKDIIEKCGIQESNIGFEEFSCVAEGEKQKFTVLENSEIITMYTDKIIN